MFEHFEVPRLHVMMQHGPPPHILAAHCPRDVRLAREDGLDNSVILLRQALRQDVDPVLVGDQLDGEVQKALDHHKLLGSEGMDKPDMDWIIDGYNFDLRYLVIRIDFKCMVL